LAALLRFARSVGLALVLFPVGFATHEAMHLLIYTVAGVRAALVVTRWRVGVGSLAIAGLHAAPLGPAGLGGPELAAPLWLLVANNGLGPLLAASFLLVLWVSVSRRSRVARTALLANVAVLLFFSLIEMAYPLLEHVARVDADVLLLPAVNYGGALLVLLGVAAASVWAWPGPGRRLRVVGSRGPGSSGGRPAGGRLPAR
jgi:hypothetical protein